MYRKDEEIASSSFIPDLRKFMGMEIIYRQFAISRWKTASFPVFASRLLEISLLFPLIATTISGPPSQDCVSAPAASHPKPKVQYQPWELALINCCRDSVRPVTEGYVPLLHTRLSSVQTEESASSSLLQLVAFSAFKGHVFRTSNISSISSLQDTEYAVRRQGKQPKCHMIHVYVNRPLSHNSCNDLGLVRGCQESTLKAGSLCTWNGPIGINIFCRARNLPLPLEARRRSASRTMKGNRDS